MCFKGNLSQPKANNSTILVQSSSFSAYTLQFYLVQQPIQQIKMYQHNYIDSFKYYAQSIFIKFLRILSNEGQIISIKYDTVGIVINTSLLSQYLIDCQETLRIQIFFAYGNFSISLRSIKNIIIYLFTYFLLILNQLKANLLIKIPSTFLKIMILFIPNCYRINNIIIKCKQINYNQNLYYFKITFRTAKCINDSTYYPAKTQITALLQLNLKARCNGVHFSLSNSFWFSYLSKSLSIFWQFNILLQMLKHMMQKILLLWFSSFHILTIVTAKSIINITQSIFCINRLNILYLIYFFSFIQICNQQSQQQQLQFIYQMLIYFISLLSIINCQCIENAYLQIPNSVRKQQSETDVIKRLEGEYIIDMVRISKQMINQKYKYFNPN
ncbi:unnamed protein product (macronuclear) [Paramecium tetraurelia]|uniref:Transmembrane protein n=1 Tax=Paramecium tetraurelia TaxID=5888 RepID=A0E9U5_PARTE|nr:uncharacterized protein GSPATT00024793001 [Paramecium tetraurelia]CAK92062.1 unnamed protein product [Paramecium tetraurelia]|eukprot:XP_001459459.1 hypothetical protein (macronuclear) [Paramecium tetraurelia strain d4-2]